MRETGSLRAKIISLFGFASLVYSFHCYGGSNLDGYCGKAERIMKNQLAAEFGSTRGFRGNQCGADSLSVLPNGNTLIAASYDTPFGFTPYVVIFDSKLNIVCESIVDECTKSRTVTSEVQSKLNISIDGIWNTQTEAALWSYGKTVGLTKHNANLSVLILALLGNDIRPLK